MRSRVVKSAARGSFVIFSLLLILSAASVATRAQSAGDAIFNVPFEFMAGNVRLPAGEYVVRRTSESGSTYFVRSRDGRTVATLSVRNNARAGAEGGPAHLTFNVYGGEHFLSQVRPGAARTVAEFHKGRAEREVMRAATAGARSVRVVASSR